LVIIYKLIKNLENEKVTLEKQILLNNIEHEKVIKEKEAKINEIKNKYDIISSKENDLNNIISDLKAQLQGTNSTQSEKEILLISQMENLRKDKEKIEIENREKFMNKIHEKDLEIKRIYEEINKLNQEKIGLMSKEAELQKTLKELGTKIELLEKEKKDSQTELSNLRFESQKNFYLQRINLLDPYLLLLLLLLHQVRQEVEVLLRILDLLQYL